MARKINTMAITILVVLGIFLLPGCDQRPGTAMCGEYYRKVVQLTRSGPQVLAVAMASGSVKSSVMNYCLEQQRHHIECGINAGSLAELQACETAEKKSIMDSLPRMDSFQDKIEGF